MDYNIMEYGAVADGTTNNSGAIQAAVDACTEAGGGRVIVPTGRFLSGTIVLKSNVTLYLEKGAELISSLRKEDILDFFGNSEFEDPSEATGWEGGCFLVHCMSMTSVFWEKVRSTDREIRCFTMTEPMVESENVRKMSV